MSELHPHVRQLTGKPYLYGAYVFDRAAGKTIAGCLHHHRTEKTAMVCAKQQTRAALAKATNGG